MRTKIFEAPSYAPEKITGRYVRRLSKRDGFKVLETATGTGRFAGRPGYGPTLREYRTDGAEIPEAIKAQASAYGDVVEWPLA